MTTQTPPHLEFLCLFRIHFQCRVWKAVGTFESKLVSGVPWTLCINIKFVVAFPRSQVVWDTALCQWVATAVWKEQSAFFFWACFGSSWPLQIEGTTFVENGRNHFPVDAASYPQRPISLVHVQLSIYLQKSSTKEAVDGIKTSVNSYNSQEACKILIIFLKC